GVMRGGDPVAGAVYAPVVGDMYSAAAGRGAFLDDRPIGVSGSDELATALLATGFSYHIGGERERQARRIARILPRVRDVRRSGSAAIDLATVAAGRVDGYFEAFINSWDVVAGVLLVREAGGTVTSFDGSALDLEAPAGVIASSPALHDEIAELVQD
ncbi:MAG: inositol monophosphatase family protein, partial [Actinomycetota bacterium]